MQINTAKPPAVRTFGAHALHGAVARAAVTPFVPMRPPVPDSLTLPRFNAPNSGARSRAIVDATVLDPLGVIRVSLSPVNTWIPVTVDRPTIFLSTVAEDGAGLNGAAHSIRYAAAQPEASAVPFGAQTQYAEGGVGFLSGPGVWFLRFVTIGAALPAAIVPDVLLIDASQFGAARKWLERDGCSSVNELNVALTTTNTVNVLPANVNRKAVILQNVPPTLAGPGSTIRVSVSMPSTYLGVGAVGTAWNPGIGYRLPVNSVLELHGKKLSRGTILATLEDAANPSNLEILEFNGN